MNKQDFIQLYDRSDQVMAISGLLSKDQESLSMTNLNGSSLSFVLASLFRKSDKPFLVICNDKEEAAYYLNDLEQLLSPENIFFYPGSYRRPYQIEETDNANILLRAEVLNRINSQKKASLILTYPEALFEKTITKSELTRNSLNLQLGEKITLDFINELLFEYQFNRVDFVGEPGDFAVRGGIIDVFSFSNDEPFRIEFFGDEIESLRTFDVETQLSLEKLKKINIMPNVENKMLNEKRESFISYLSKKTVIFVESYTTLKYDLDKLYQKAEETFQKDSGLLKLTSPDINFL